MDNHPNNDGHENWQNTVEYQQPRPETSFWREVREHLENRDNSLPGQIPPVARCPICLEAELDIQGLPPSSGNPASVQSALITICGHMACHDCLATWYEACATGQQVVRCPVCMHQLQFAAEDCGHVMTGYPLPGNDGARFNDDASYLKKVPLTLPENGTQPKRCNPCRRLLNTDSMMLSLHLRLRNQLGKLGTELRVTGDITILPRIRVCTQAWREGRAAVYANEKRETREDDEHPGWGLPFPTSVEPVATEYEISLD